MWVVFLLFLLLNCKNLYFVQIFNTVCKIWYLGQCLLFKKWWRSFFFFRSYYHSFSVLVITIFFSGYLFSSCWSESLSLKCLFFLFLFLSLMSYRLATISKILLNIHNSFVYYQRAELSPSSILCRSRSCVFMFSLKSHL